MKTAARKQLIVNADDFGLCPGVNRAIVEAHRDGIVTRASLMVRWPGAPEAAEMGRANPRLGVGLHLDLGEWTFRDGQWMALYEVVRFNDPAAVEAEVARQLEAFRRLTGRDPTHIDSHQHVHRRDTVAPVVKREADRLGVPLRHFGPARYCGDFYGQTGEGAPLPDLISVESLLAILSRLPEATLTELCCHPGYADGLEGTGTMYVREREMELAALRDPRVRRFIADAGIELIFEGA